MRTILVNLPGRMVIDGNAFVMLIKQERFRGFYRRRDRRRHSGRGPDEPAG